jgi:hypothetical protein
LGGIKGGFLWGELKEAYFGGRWGLSTADQKRPISDAFIEFLKVPHYKKPLLILIKKPFLLFFQLYFSKFIKTV